MSTDTQQLIQQSLQGDQRAFGQIVERYQGAVSAMAYSVTGNLAQSEDLAQEAFIIAWKKLGALQKHESLSAWLCGIARNLARDWMRTQAARPTVSMESIDEAAQPLGESSDAPQHQRERADLVWTALAEIPENYREPLILFYRQGESIRDIAEALELSEDNVKQRLSRGRKLLRAEVARTVEDTLADTRPGKKFTAGVIAALPALYGTKAGAAELIITSAKAAAAPAAMGALMKIALPVAVVGALVLGAAVWYTPPATSDMDLSADHASRESNEIEQVDSVPGSEVLNTTAFNGRTELQVDTVLMETIGTNVSGVVVFADSGAPAPNMRVELRNVPAILQFPFHFQGILSDGAGSFTLPALRPGTYTLVAYDARHEKLPESYRRSKEIKFTIPVGDDSNNLRIEVPPLGSELTGRITAAGTGEAIEGIKVAVGLEGAAVLEGMSDSEGRYRVLGLRRGTWKVRLDSNNNFFVSDNVSDLENLVIDGIQPAKLDFTLDPGVSVTGMVVDAGGDPVPQASVDAKLFLPGNLEQNCYVKTGDRGEFTIWGAKPGDRVVVSARKDDWASHVEVVEPKLGEPTEKKTLTLLPTTRVSGRFVDEDNRPVAAALWSQPFHPTGLRNWRGQGEKNTTFSVALAQGPHELMGFSKGVVLNRTNASQHIDVGPEAIHDLVIEVATRSSDESVHSLSGRVVDEVDKPIAHCRVYVRGDSRETIAAGYQETRTDDAGLFQFHDLSDGAYSVHAMPERAVYEEFSGHEHLNPVDSPEILIVVRRAATLNGRVLDAASGEPLSTFTIEYGELGNDGREYRLGPSSPDIHAGNGEFSTPVRLDVDWYLRVSAEGYAPQRIDGPAMGPGEISPTMEFKLSLGRRAGGTVVDSQGVVVPRARIYLNKGFAKGPSILGSAVTETDSDGRFALNSIADEEDYVYAWKEGFAVVREPLGQEIRMVLHHGGGIEGRLTANGEIPSGSYSIVAKIPGTEYVTSTRIESDGTYRFGGLMEIAYRIQVTLEQEDNSSKYYHTGEVVQVRRDQITTHDIDIPVGTGIVEGTLRQAGAPVAGLRIICRNNGLSTHVTSDNNGSYRFEDLSPGTVVIAAPVATDPNGGTYGDVGELEIVADEIIRHDIELQQ